MKKSIYLDSNDFSDLSAPMEDLREEDRAVLDALRKATKEETAMVLLSPPLLSEAVHATEASKEHSLRRANLMRELCGTNFVHYPTDISKTEFARAIDNSSPIPVLKDFLSSEGEWFGTPYNTQSLKEARQEAMRQLDERLKPFPRAERRKLKSQLNPSKASSRPLLRQLITEGRSPSDQAEFPLNMLDQNLYLDWFLGEATDFSLQEHLHRILCDPYVLFKHVVDETGHREQLYNMVRTGGANISASFEKFGQQFIYMAELSAQRGEKLNARELANELISDAFLRTIVASISELKIDQLSDAELLDITSKCPSASTLTKVLRAYIETLVQSNLTRARQSDSKPAKPKASDFGDLMHVFYAPYVDIFRCDARFGEHLKNNEITKGRIASRRSDILKML